MEGKVRENVCAAKLEMMGGLPWQVREMHTQVRSRDFLLEPLKRSNRQAQVPGPSLHLATKVKGLQQLKRKQAVGSSRKREGRK